MASDSELIPPVYSAASPWLRPDASDTEMEFDEARMQWLSSFFFCLFRRFYAIVFVLSVNKRPQENYYFFDYDDMLKSTPF